MIQLGGGPTIGAVEGVLDEGNQVTWVKGLNPENHFHSLILNFGFCQAAYHDHRNFPVEASELPDELEAVHIRHEVVSDNETDLLPARLAPEQCQSALPVRSHMALEVG